jgi:hypothetical protein
MSLLLAAAVLAAAPAAQAPIRPEALRAHMTFLASDLLEGRRTGTRGYDLAAAYVAARYESIGLRPAFGTSYFQQVPFREGVVAPEGAEVLLRQGGAERQLVLRADFVALPNLLEAKVEVDAPVVYVGFGVTAKERGYDDYADLDVRGKVVVLSSGAPPSFPDDVRAHYGSSRNKRETAALHGAAGILSFTLPADARRFPWDRMTRELGKGSNAWKHPDGRVQGQYPELKAAVILSPPQAESLFGGKDAFAQVVKDSEAGRPKTGPMPLTARLRLVTKHRDYESPNVVGILDGSDAALAKEAVVFSAHLDHEGTGEPRDGDGIWNGFFDNASGIATLLEMAGSLVAEKARPKRSLVFLACAAEEEGLLGSDYFAHYPVLEPVADVNTDMFLALFPLKQIIAFGSDHSSLGPIVKDEAQKHGFVLGADPFPRESIFTRSDQYPFVKAGVPAVMIAAGFEASDTKARDAILGWTQTRYHSPKDDASQEVDWDSLVRFAELNRRIGQRLANDPARPAWNKDDFFGGLFGGRR